MKSLIRIFALMIKGNTAKALGLTIRESLLLRADQIIQYAVYRQFPRC